MNSKQATKSNSSGLFSLLGSTSKISSRIASKNTNLESNKSSLLFSQPSTHPNPLKTKTTGNICLSDEEDSNCNVIEEDPVPRLISIYITCPEREIEFFEKAIMRSQRAGDIQIDLPSHWGSQRSTAFVLWASKLGIRKSMFGMQLKLVVPRSLAVYLRRCIQAVSRVASDESNTSILQTSRLSDAPSPADRASELSKQSVASLKELCRSYGIKTGGRKQEMIDRLLSVEQAVKDGLIQKEERANQSQVSLLSITPIKSRLRPPTEPTNDVDDEESLLHQLRREAFYRDHKDGDYYHDAKGQYNLSLDDQSFSELQPSQTSNRPSFLSQTNSFMMPPPTSRLSISRSAISESSFLGDLPHLSTEQKKLLRRRMSIAITPEMKLPPKRISKLHSRKSAVLRASLLHHVVPYLTPAACQTVASMSLFYHSLMDLCNSLASIADPTHSPFCSSTYFDSFYEGGRVIGEGGYKIVLQCIRPSGQEEAVSIMDLQDLRNKDLLVVAQQEMQSALLLSLLSKYRIVPFFTEIYSLFHASYKPSFLSVARESQHYLYTRMELANQGDLEGYLRHQAPSTACLLQVFLQMVLSLYTAFHSLSLVHYDVKLLNFLVHVSPSTDRVIFSLPWGSYTLPPIQNQRFTIKLTDFGTAEMQAEGPLTVGQFTTFENTPPEYLLSSQAQRGPAADCWNLGLSLFHLLLQEASYEVVLAECVCPPEFDLLVRSFWTPSTRSARSDTFGVLRHVLKDDDQNILSATLYRQLVLWFHPNLPDSLLSSSLWNRIHTILTGRGKSRTDTLLKEKYEKDAAMYSWYGGNHPLLQQARRICREIDGLEDVLLNLVQFDPTARMTFEDVLKHPVFQPLRLSVPGSSRDTVYTIDVNKLRDIFVKEL